MDDRTDVRPLHFGMGTDPFADASVGHWGWCQVVVLYGKIPDWCVTERVRVGHAIHLRLWDREDIF